MSPKSKHTVFLSIICLLVILGCRALFPVPPTAVPDSVSTPAVAPVDTLPPVNTDPQSCSVDQTLKGLKSRVNYGESVVLHNKVESTSFLVVWFVDPELNPAAKESEITENTELAIRHALIVSQELNASDICVSQLFTVINAIVVDQNYNGWLSGQISTANLPATVQTGETQLDKMAEQYEIGYVRSQVPAKLGSAPAGSCNWSDANKNIYNHFSSERPNVGFYFVRDDTGVNVWAQWDSQPDYVQMVLPAAILNVQMEIDCLFPTPDRIMINIVDETGEIRLIGQWDWAAAQKQDISKIQILYQK